MTEYRTKILIIGSGPAGYTAAIYTARANLSPLLVTGMQPGGQMTITTDVENYPGFAEVIQGPWLMEQMQKQAEAVGTKMLYDAIASVDFSKRPFVCKGESGDTYVADVVIVSTGAQAKWLGLPSEEKYRGYGISGCATCDGFFFRDKEVAVIGGGNTAIEEALYLSNHASKITIIHRRDAFKAEKILQDRLLEDPKISILWNHVVEEFMGEDNPPELTGLKLKNVKTAETRTLNISGAFVAIGHKPSTEVFGGHLEIDEAGYIVCKPGATKTSVPGVFAAGDVQDAIYRQAITAAGQGCMAALDAARFLAEHSVPA